MPVGKACTKCGSTTNVFGQHKGSKDGIRNVCNPCNASEAREYHAKNAERHRERMSAWKAANQDKVRASAKRNYESSKEERREYSRAYHKAHCSDEAFREKAILRSRAWLAARNASPEWKAGAPARLLEKERRKAEAVESRRAARIAVRQEAVAKSLAAMSIGNPSSDADMPDVSGIYRILNCANGRLYVGSAVNMRKRARMHTVALDAGNHGNRVLQRAWNKWGRAAFLFSVLEAVNEKHLLVAREQHYIDLHRSTAKEFGYNLSPTAGSQLGFKCSPESVEKMAAGHRGRKQSPETIAKRQEWRRLQSPEERAATRDKKSASLREAHALRSYERKLEIHAKIGAAHKGKSPSEETRRKIAATLLGRKQTSELIAKRVAGRMKHSELRGA